MASISFTTYGCSNNFSESEVMQGLLEKEGHEIKESFDTDIVIFNMCSVKGPSVNQCLMKIREIKKKTPKKKIIVTGCVTPQLTKEITGIGKGISVLNTHHITEINKAVEDALNENTDIKTTFTRTIKLNLPRKRKNSVIGIVPILSGCNNFCTYCYTKLIKGPTFSYPSKSIIKEVEQAVKDGCIEIWLTSQDNAVYMTDKGNKEKENIDLAKLIRKITQIDGVFYIRIGMANPTYLLPYIDELIEVLKDDKVFKFLHIPIQSGNNRILKEMNRSYTVEQYKEIIKKLKKHIPDITIATDIIVGFPTETEDEFEDTLTLIKETRPQIVNISRYQARPGTKAAAMTQVPQKTLRERSQRLTTLFRKISLEENEKMIGKMAFVVIDEHRKGHSIGKDINYRNIVIKEQLPLAKIVKVSCISAGTFFIEGKVLKK